MPKPYNFTIKSKIAYSLGAIATALSYQAFSTYIIFFYVDVIKLAAGLAAAGMLIYAIWNAINDPIAGFISDQTRTPWGRRIPYIAIGTIPFSIIYFLLWTPPFDATQMLWLFAYFMVFICLFDLGYTVVILNWAALYPEMFPSLSERAQVNAFRQAFGMLGLIIGIALPPLLYSTIGWKWMGLFFGIIVAATLLISLLGSHERKEFSLDKPLGIKESFLTTFSSKSFLVFVISNMFVQYVFTIILAAVPFFAKYVLRVGAKETSFILLATFLTAIPMMYVWRKIVVKLGAKKTYLAAICLLGISLLPFFTVQNLLACIISTAFVGVGLAGIILISDILISDIIDEDELRSQTRREGMFFGFNALITRLAISLEAGSLGLIFTLTGYNAHLPTQPNAFLSGLRFLIAGLPILALIIAFLVMAFYPLAGERGVRMRIDLEKLHAEKLGGRKDK